MNPGLLRSAFAGQGNAILLGPALRVVSHDVLTLNPPGAPAGAEPRARPRPGRAARLGEGAADLPDPSGRAGASCVANLHATSSPGDARIPGAELRRAAAAVQAHARDGDTVVVGGDFNVEAGVRALDGFSAPGPGIDQLLVRGAPASPVRVWPDERRRKDGMLLSDHSPIEIELDP